MGQTAENKPILGDVGQREARRGRDEIAQNHGESAGCREDLTQAVERCAGCREGGLLQSRCSRRRAQLHTDVSFAAYSGYKCMIDQRAGGGIRIPWHH